MELPDFGERVQALRLRRRWSQSHLAKRAGLSADTVSRIERAQFHPTLDTMIKLAGAFGLPLEIMIKRDLDLPDELAALIRELSTKDQHVAFAMLGALRMSRAIGSPDDQDG